MELKKTTLPPTARCPHEVVSLLHALHAATACLLNPSVTLSVTEEMYAVFEEKSTANALAMLFIGFSRIAPIEEIGAEETANKIFISLTGKLRLARDNVSYRDILPERAEHATLLDRLLDDNRMTYGLECDGGGLRLTVSLPRFLTATYDVCAFNPNVVHDNFYDMMLFLSGEAPKRTLQE